MTHRVGWGFLASGHKFGTFGGVFTPSILTILGVIMYLRLPQIVGEGGLTLAVGIILAAHLISVTTGLSVSSIATDKRVRAGGAYYIVSRSLGLAMGGTLGIALFVGLSFSISLYIIGFSVSLLDYYQMDQDLATIRVCGTITLVVLTVITFLSTSLAIRAQYVILALILGSLASILLGGPEVPPETPHLAAWPTGRPPTDLFGIFFPAVTGFTAGVNMSGDLRDPRRAIPLGTVMSIGVGMLVYLGLAVFMAYRIPAADLVSVETILVDIAWSPRLVVLGVWGATLSSALGSILGAPRILQALSLDQITPRVFGIGHGRGNEPRYALLLAFAIGEAGILIGDLDAIARLVSVFFIATYGFLNLSASFEMIASPDFRPDFRIPVWVPILGAATCGVLLIWLDLMPMLVAVGAMFALFFVLKRRELQLETGDTLLGVWSSVVRVGLHRLTQESLHQRNWRPNILLFTRRDAESRQPLLEFGTSLIRYRGVATEFVLTEGASRRAAGAPEAEAVGDQQQGLFHREVAVSDDEYGTMAAVCRFHGFSGLEPNTVMLDWHHHAQQAQPFAHFLGQLSDLDVNVLGIAYDPDKGFGARQRIDLWWSPEAGSLSLNLALVRFVTASDEWRHAQLRFLVIADDPTLADPLRKATAAALDEARVVGKIKVIRGTGGRSHADWIAHHSARTDLTVIGLPRRGLTTATVLELERLVGRIGCVLLVRGSSQFVSDRASVSPGALAREVTDDPGPIALERLRFPSAGALEPPARQFADRHSALIQDFCDRGLAPICGAPMVLLDGIRGAIEATLADLDRAMDRGVAWRIRALGQARRKLLAALREHMAAYEHVELLRVQGTAEVAIDTLLQGLDQLEDDFPDRLVVDRDPAEVAWQPGDPAWLRRAKGRQRLVARVLRRPPRTVVRPAGLVRHYLDVQTLSLAQTGLTRAANHTMLFLDDVSRLVQVLRDGLTLLQHDNLAGTLDRAALTAEADRIGSHLDALIRSHVEVAEGLVADIVQSSRGQQQAFSDDLGHIHLSHLVQHERRTPRAARHLPQQLVELPSIWVDRQAGLLRRAELAAILSVVQVRLAAAVDEVCHTLQHAMQDLQRRCGAVLVVLRNGQSDPALMNGDLKVTSMVGVLDEASLVEELHQALQTATADVPEAFEVLDEGILQALESDPFADVEVVEVPLRRRLQFLIDGELVGPIQSIVAAVPRAEQRTSTMVEDVVHLVAFALSDVDDIERDETAEVDASTDPDPSAANGEAAERLVASGIERLEAEIVRLGDLQADLEEQIRERLDQVTERTNRYASGTAEAWTGLGRLAGADLSMVGALTDRVAREVKDALVTLAYRRSAGVLLARRMASVEDPGPVNGVQALVDACTPRPEVLEALPPYYSQLFAGQSALHSPFWVGRSAELDQIAEGIARCERGFHGAILVTGEPGSGKTGLCEVALERHLLGRPVVRISPPAGGSCDPDVFRDTVAAELNRTGDLDDLFDAVADGTVVLFTDAQRWWERSVRGMAVIDLLADRIERDGDRLLFLVEMGRSAFRFVDGVSSFGASVVARVDCGPVDAETLKEIVMVRHDATGLRFALDGRGEEELSAWAVAQLFSAHFDHSDGNVAAALAGWLAHVVSVDGDTVVVRRPRGLADDALDRLPADWVALLLQLVLHKEMTVEGLLRISGVGRIALERDLAALRRTGLVTRRRRGVVTLAPRIRHLVLRSLRRRGVLP